jgi:hypothetical protein
LVPSSNKNLSESAQDAPAANTTVWGVLVPSQSANTLRNMGLLAILTVVLLAGAVAFLLWRGRRPPQSNAQDRGS